MALSDSANQGLYIRNFLISQGYTMEPVMIYQDNTSCMALAEKGRSGAERTRHIGIRYFGFESGSRSERRPSFTREPKRCTLMNLRSLYRELNSCMSVDA